MSLYEKYNSQINVDHMYNITDDILKKQFNIDIMNIPQSKENFITTMKEIFDNNNVDELTDLNKILLEHHIEYYTKQTEANNQDVNESFNALLEERNQNKVITLKGNKGEKIYKDTDENQPLEEIKKQPSISKEVKKVITFEQIVIQSKERNNMVSSRYNFTCNISDSKNMHHISRVILPIEDNYIFSSPIISVKILELEHKLHLEKKHVLTNGTRRYGIYEPFEIQEIKQKDVDTLTIDIRDFNDIQYKRNDTLRINMLEIVKDIIKLTCSTIYKGDFQENDYIYIINNGDMKDIYTFISEPLKISSIKDNIIYCRLYQVCENNLLNDIDMSILNLNNQSTIYFNK